MAMLNNQSVIPHIPHVINGMMIDHNGSSRKETWPPWPLYGQESLRGAPVQYRWGKRVAPFSGFIYGYI